MTTKTSYGILQDTMSMGVRALDSESARSAGIAPPMDVNVGKHGRRGPEVDEGANHHTYPTQSLEVSYAARVLAKVAAAIQFQGPAGTLSEAGPEPMSHALHARVEQTATPKSLNESGRRALKAYGL